MRQWNWTSEQFAEFAQVSGGRNSPAVSHQNNTAANSLCQPPTQKKQQGKKSHQAETRSRLTPCFDSVVSTVTPVLSPKSWWDVQTLGRHIYFHSCAVYLCHSVSVTKTLRRAVEHASDMIPRHASQAEGHIHLAAGLTDSSKGRQADTGRGQ